MGTEVISEMCFVFNYLILLIAREYFMNLAAVIALVLPKPFVALLTIHSNKFPCSVTR
jgi:hypothetical protein